MELDEKYDVIMIGGGAGALAASIYTCRADLKTLILERKYVGGQVIITTDVDNYPGFPDGINGVELIQRMEMQAKRFGVEIRNEEVVKIDVEAGKKVVTTDSAVYAAPILILAMGADPRKLDVPGENELVGRGVSYCGTCDGPFFRDKDVVVAGGGDSAITEAIFIAKFVKSMTIVHRRDTLRAEKILQNEITSNPKASFMWNSKIEKISGNNKVEEVSIVNVVDGGKKNLPCGGVFIFIGNEPNTGFLGNLLPADAGSHIETDQTMETAVKGIFAIGDVRKNSFRQIATAVGEGVTAAIAAEHRLGDMRNKG